MSIQSVRPTCRSFDRTAVKLLGEALPALRRRLDLAGTRFLSAAWLRTNHPDNEARLSYCKRLARGAASLLALARLVRVADTCSRQLLRAGALPPPHAALLTQLQAAVNMATRRNPLVGVDRLRLIYHHVLAYFRHKITDPQDLPPSVMFRTVLDVLQGLPGLTTEISLERNGPIVTLSCSLPPTRIELPSDEPDCSSATADLLLQKLVQLGVHLVEAYISTGQAQRVVGGDPLGGLEAYVTAVQVTVTCACVVHQEPSLQQLSQLEPLAFTVTLSGFQLTSQPDLQDLHPQDDFTFRYYIA